MITYGFQQIATLIGGPATVFMATLLIVIILRIGIAFLFKLFRLNIDYHSLQYKSNWRSENPNGYDYRNKK